jgi:hypothetical protein
MMEKGVISKVYGQFMLNRKAGYFATSANSNWFPFENYHLALEGYSTLHQQSTEENQGLTSFGGSIPLILQQFLTYYF